jgi:hypothetical protein
MSNKIIRLTKKIYRITRYPYLEKEQAWAMIGKYKAGRPW